MRKLIPLLAAALAAAPMLASAQTGQDDDSTLAAFGARGLSDPAGRVLEQREELVLTGEQVAELHAIQARFHAINEPLLEQLRDALPEERAAGDPRARGQTRAEPAERLGERRPEDRRRTERDRESRESRRTRMGEARGSMAEVRPVLQELRENQHRAEREVAAVLRADQQAVLDARRDQQQTRRDGLREQRRERTRNGRERQTL